MANHLARLALGFLAGTGCNEVSPLLFPPLPPANCNGMEFQDSPGDGSCVPREKIVFDFQPHRRRCEGILEAHTAYDPDIYCPEGNPEQEVTIPGFQGGSPETKDAEAEAIIAGVRCFFEGALNVEISTESPSPDEELTQVHVGGVGTVLGMGSLDHENRTQDGQAQTVEFLGDRRRPVESMAMTTKHEIGHNLGLDHSDDPRSIMAARVFSGEDSATICTRRFTAEEIRQLFTYTRESTCGQGDWLDTAPDGACDDLLAEAIDIQEQCVEECLDQIGDI